MSTTRRNLTLGVFFVAVVAILSYYTLFLTDFRLFGERVSKTIYFPETNGLRQGDSVLVAGVRWGKVESLVFDPEADRSRRIEVVISLDERVALHEDHTIRIKDATLLGGKNLAIDPGLPTSPTIPDTRELYGAVSSNVLEALDDLVAENRASIRQTLSDLQTIVADVREGRGIAGRLLADEQLAQSFASGIESISVSFDNVDALTSGLREGRGTLGRLFTDEELYERIDSIGRNFDDLLGESRELVADVRRGNGTVGRLIYDEALSEDVAATARSVRDIVEGIQQGEGTIGRFVKDETLADDIQNFTQKLTSGEGTIGRLLTDGAVYDNLLQITDDLRVSMAALRNGEGTIGKLVFDDEIYQELQRAMGTLAGSLEEAREAAPVSTFLNTVFLGF